MQLFMTLVQITKASKIDGKFSIQEIIDFTKNVLAHWSCDLKR